MFNFGIGAKDVVNSRRVLVLVVMAWKGRIWKSATQFQQDILQRRVINRLVGILRMRRT